MTDWNRILHFYKLVSQREITAPFGEAMFTLVSQIKDTPNLSYVEARTAMYNLMLWIEGGTEHLYIGWKDNRYRLSFNAFADIDYESTELEVLDVIESCLKQMQGNVDNNNIQ